MHKNTYIFFSLFSAVSRFVSPVVLPYCGPRCSTPLYYPVALPRCWVEVLEPTVAKTDDLGLVPIFKKIIQKKL